ncbi:NVEALA domain-containing protein [Parabacteroides pacaensis]|uniref:NVEALA domain-containing protein n=1 Tax=Parabacteroides pacaensis TaxID=2086575 RepID=UPI000D0F6881|nr:NVEALA domain-containing protein [Parabacteroides pacaensis]
MKINFFWATLTLVILFTAGWNFNQSKNKVGFSNLTLANIEALAQGENEGSHTDQACITCISPEGYRGVRFYCKYGTGGCYDSVCTAGSCGGI